MKTFFLLITSVILFAAFIWAVSDDPHTCADRTHELCDGMCQCDGMQCDKAVNQVTTKAYIKLHDYQIDLESDSIAVYDCGRLVGKVFLTDDTPLGSLLLDDNE